MAKKAKEAKETEKAAQPKSWKDRTTEQGIAHAINHTVRLDALSILFERLASPKEIAAQLRVPLATVSFHITELVADDAIELVKTEPRRGAVEHFYRAKMRPEVSDANWQSMPKATRRKFAANHLQAIIAEGLSSLRHSRMEKDDLLHLSWMPMRVDEEGRKEVADLQAEMLERYAAIKERNESRVDEDGDAGTTVVAAILGFERARPGIDPRARPRKKSSKG